MHQKTHTKIIPEVFLQRHSEAIKDYTTACWKLADVLSQGKREYGRDRTIRLGLLPLKKVNWFTGIASIQSRNPNLLPEHHAEVIGLKNPGTWLNVAVKGNLNPVKLRERIRKRKGVVQIESAPKGIAGWPKQLIMIQSELSQMKPEQKAKALEYIKTQLG